MKSEEEFGGDEVVLYPIVGYHLRDVIIPGEIVHGQLVLNSEKSKAKLKGEIMSKKKKSKGGRGSALLKELNCSDELRAVIKKKQVSRGKSMKFVWKYIKKHKLQDKKDRRVINPDKKLAAVIGKKPIKMTQLGGKVFAHLSE